LANSLSIAVKALPGILRYYLGTPTPLIWANKVTFRCNYRCGFCPIWKMKPGTELSTAAAKRLVREAAGLGVVFASFEGGEPLLRKDLPGLLSEAKKCGMLTSIITNGALVPQRIDEIAEFTDVITVSLDGKPDTHDLLRGKKGAFKGVQNALDAAKGKKPRVFLNCVITAHNKEELGWVAKFAKKNGVMASFCPVAGFKGADDMGLPEGELKRVAESILQLKGEGYPIVNSRAYLRALIDAKLPRCRTGEVFLHTDPDGDIVLPCYAWKGEIAKFPGMRGKPLREAWFSKEAADLRKEAVKCRGCGFIDCVETSLLLSPRLDLFLEMAKVWDGMGAVK